MDPLPLCSRQMWTLLACALRELLWGLRAVSRELDGWRERARAIPDAPLRVDALESIARKRCHADGAALFWILPRRRHPRLLELLVAYQTAWDYLDNASEPSARNGVSAGANHDLGACAAEEGVHADAAEASARADADAEEASARQLHLALVEALDPGAPRSDYYSRHRYRHDGGYLHALAGVAREGCAGLPSYERVRAPVLAEAARCAVQSINHHPDPERRDNELRAWAEREFPAWPEGSWFERTAAASASLVPHVLLALAVEPACEPQEVAHARAVYLPWVSLATAMLDSYSDLEEDLESGEHSYIAHYGEREAGVARLAEIVARAAGEARGLHGGRRHAVVVASVVAMYLSQESARTASALGSSERLVRAGGSLARLLAPVLRVWRIADARRAV